MSVVFVFEAEIELPPLKEERGGRQTPIFLKLAILLCFVTIKSSSNPVGY